MIKYLRIKLYLFNNTAQTKFEILLTKKKSLKPLFNSIVINTLLVHRNYLLKQYQQMINMANINMAQPPKKIHNGTFLSFKLFIKLVLYCLNSYWFGDRIYIVLLQAAGRNCLN